MIPQEISKPEAPAPLRPPVTCKGGPDERLSVEEAMDRLLVGDSRDVLPMLPAECVDLVHTSPPYNIEKSYAHSADNLAHEDYLELLRRVFRECYRVLKPGASLFLQTGYSQNGGDEIFPIDMLAYGTFRDLGFRLWDRVIWHYRGGMSFTRKFKNTHETILWWVKPRTDGEFHPYFDVDAIREASRSYDKRNNLFGKNPGNVWSADRVAYGGRDRDTTHIAMYPDSVTERIIRSCSRPGDLVLDPFAGSGTTPAMSRALGRRWIGIELSPTYVEEAQRRIGRRQAGEVQTLAAGILKLFAFANQPSQRTMDFVTQTFVTWLQRIDLEKYANMRDERLGGMYKEDLVTSKEVRNQKPKAWAFFDDYFQRADPQAEVLALASHILDSAYPQRSRWNSIRKFVHSLDAITELRQLIDGEPKEFVLHVLKSEPTSFNLLDGETSVALVASDVKVRRAVRASSAEPQDGQVSLFDM